MDRSWVWALKKDGLEKKKMHLTDKFLTSFLQVLTKEHAVTGSNLRDSRGTVDREDWYMQKRHKACVPLNPQLLTSRLHEKSNTV